MNGCEESYCSQASNQSNQSAERQPFEQIARALEAAGRVAQMKESPEKSDDCRINHIFSPLKFLLYSPLLPACLKMSGQPVIKRTKKKERCLLGRGYPNPTQDHISNAIRLLGHFVQWLAKRISRKYIGLS